MGDVLFTFDVNATPDTVRRALTTTEGITSFWTDKADVPAEVGETLTLGFPDAPVPFDLLLAQSDDKVIIWRTATFPPQWVGTDIRRELSGGDGTSIVAFRHGSFADETEEGDERREKDLSPQRPPDSQAAPEGSQGHSSGERGPGGQRSARLSVDSEAGSKTSPSPCTRTSIGTPS